MTVAPNNMVYSLNQPNIDQTRPTWSLDPSGGTIPTFTISYQITSDKSGTVAPNWLYIDGSSGTDKITIDGTDPAITTQYMQYFLQGCVDGETPARCEYEPFMVLIFDLIVSSPAS